MNKFMNALYNAVGSVITGNKNGIPFLAYVSDTRVKYGADISVSISYDQDSIQDMGICSDIIDGSVLFNGGNGVFENLHIYFE